MFNKSAENNSLAGCEFINRYSEFSEIDQSVLEQESGIIVSLGCQHEDVDQGSKSSQRIRSLFLSDVHLGSPYSYAEELLGFLKQYTPERIYLVGDLIDGRKLSRKWYWTPVYTELLERLFTLGKAGTRVFYLPGNHDEFMRLWEQKFGYEMLKSLPLTIVNEMVHVSVDGRKYLVVHGDQFDQHECEGGYVSRMTSVLYDWMLKGTRLAHRYYPRRFPQRHTLSAKFKSRLKKLEEFTRGFRSNAVEYARQKHCDGVICGHIHQPLVERHDKLVYYNTGDWVEHCTAVVEFCTGELDILYFDNVRGQVALSEEFLEK